MSPSQMKSLKVHTPIHSSSKWIDCTLGIEFSTIMRGLTSLPASHAILIDHWLSFTKIETNSLIFPAHLSIQKTLANFFY